MSDELGDADTCALGVRPGASIPVADSNRPRHFIIEEFQLFFQAFDPSEVIESARLFELLAKSFRSRSIFGFRLRVQHLARVAEAQCLSVSFSGRDRLTIEV